MSRARSADVDATLVIRVQPRSSRNAVAGWIGDRVKLSVTAPPVEGAANTACRSLLAELLDIPLSRIDLVKGEHSRNKVVRILGLTQEQVHARLSRPSPR